MYLIRLADQDDDVFASLQHINIACRSNWGIFFVNATGHKLRIRQKTNNKKNVNRAIIPSDKVRGVESVNETRIVEIIDN